jgi:hypothetical protein
MRRYGEEWFGRNTSSLREVPVDQLTVTEGTLQILEISQLASVREQLTPSALFGLELFHSRPLAWQRSEAVRVALQHENSNTVVLTSLRAAIERATARNLICRGHRRTKIRYARLRDAIA